MVTPKVKITPLLIHNCSFSTVINCNVNISSAGYTAFKEVETHSLRNATIDQIGSLYIGGLFLDANMIAFHV